MDGKETLEATLRALLDEVKAARKQIAEVREDQRQHHERIENLGRFLFGETQ